MPRHATPRAPRAVLLATILLSAVAGCRSAAPPDVVERELRHQEDEIYCLKDYLNNYQQLLCQAREENETLKQQLGDGQAAPSPSSSKSSPSNTDLGPSRLKNPPQTPIPPAKKSNGSHFNQPETQPGVPKLEMGEPEVPPLRDTSAEDRRDAHDHGGPSNIAAKHVDNEVQAAAYEAPLPVEVPANSYPPEAPSMQTAPEPPAGRSAPPQQVMLQGAVVIDSDGDGPHVLVDVKPELASGQPIEYRGRLSLMVIDPNGARPNSRLARWDFTPDELDQALVNEADGPLLEFPLQMPTGVPTDRPVELWVRLLPEDGDKVLAHATVDLSRASQFSSAGPSAPPIVERAAPIVDRNVAPAQSIQAGVRESGWQVARPDQPQDQPSRQNASCSGWRTATDPVPLVESIPAHVDPVPLRSSPSEVSRYESPPAKVASRPSPEWSPERADDTKPAVPDWSPTR
jgi:hypothetical protein